MGMSAEFKGYCEERSIQTSQNGHNKNEIVPLTLLKQMRDVFGSTTKMLCLIDGNKGSYETELKPSSDWYLSVSINRNMNITIRFL